MCGLLFPALHIIYTYYICKQSSRKCFWSKIKYVHIITNANIYSTCIHVHIPNKHTLIILAWMHWMRQRNHGLSMYVSRQGLVHIYLQEHDSQLSKKHTHSIQVCATCTVCSTASKGKNVQNMEKLVEFDRGIRRFLPSGGVHLFRFCCGLV